MSEIKDGGPAFPHGELHDSFPREGNAMRHLHAERGISMRDYFAIHADMYELIESDGFIPQRIAVHVMGNQPPNWDNEPIAATEWWCEAEARVRYMKAGAMLKAREAS